MDERTCWRAERGFLPCEVDAVVLTPPHDRRQTEWDNACGAVAAAVLLDFAGLSEQEATSLVEKRLVVTQEGLHPVTLATFLAASGLEVCRGTMGVEDLRHHTRLGRPVACPIAEHGGHWVVALGVERRNVVIHDPLAGIRRIPQASFLAGWYDSDSHGRDWRRYGIAAWKE